MKKLMMFFFLFLSSIAFSQEKTIVIPIGGSCTTAAAIGTYNLREAAYPFDWNLTTFDSIYRLIEDDFSQFLNKDNLVRGPDLERVIDLYYGMQFVHDFPTYETPHSEELIGDGGIRQSIIREDFMDFVAGVREKYLRRIQRFRDAFNSTNKIILIRDAGDVSKFEAEMLYELINRKYPHSNFTLVICSHQKDMQISWELPGIMNFYISPYLEIAKNNEWREVFKTLGLIP